MRYSLLLLTACVLLLTACGETDGNAGAAPPAPARTMSGSVVLSESGGFGAATQRPQIGDTCSGRSGYGDVREGAQILVYTGSGDVLAAGDLSTGRYVAARQPGYAWCKFEWQVLGVPLTADFYRFTVANRQGPVFSAADLQESGYRVELDLGNGVGEIVLSAAQ